MLKRYEQQLEELSRDKAVSLKRAYRQAGVPNSTFYRSQKGVRTLSYETASKVAHAIEQLSQG